MSVFPTSLSHTARRIIYALSIVYFWPYTTVQAAIVVGHDINTLGSTVVNASPGNQEERFAVNVADFLTRGSINPSILLYESNPGDGTRNYAPSVLDALADAGFSTTVTPDYSTSFFGFDAIFVAENFPDIGFLENGQLTNYVNSGGGVYLAGGVGLNAATEAAGWASFLNSFGLAFESTGYNAIDSVPIDGTHPIFAGLTQLGSGNGQSIIDMSTNTNARIVQAFQNQGMYAVVEPIPLPPAALLFASGLAGLLLFGRKRAVL